MYHQSTCVLAVLELLQVHGRMTGTGLAVRPGVDGRTLRHFVRALLRLSSRSEVLAPVPLRHVLERQLRHLLACVGTGSAADRSRG